MAFIEPPTVDWSDVQGEILQPYGHDWSAHLLVSFPDPAAGARFCAVMRPTLATADRWNAPDDSFRNLGLTYAGLAALGLADAELVSFPYAFRRSMAGRAAELGDTGLSAPATWDTPYGDPALHAWVMVTGATQARRDAALAELRSLAATQGVTVLGGELCDDLSARAWHWGRERYWKRQNTTPVYEMRCFQAANS